MGWLATAVLLPLAPVQGMVWLARLLQEIAENELDDPAALRSKLHEAEEAHRRGDISRDELDRIQEVVFEQLVGTDRVDGGVT